VGQELRKMTAFIKQEAMEKAREIEIKADEEFAIEKSKLVRQEQASIDSSYAKKFKAASMSQQITRSTVANKMRLRVLSARQEVLDNIFEEAQKKLGEHTKDKGKYQEILKNLKLEGFYALNEESVQVRARKQDYDLVKKAIEAACKEYKENLKRDISATIDEENPLPEGWYVHVTDVELHLLTHVLVPEVYQLWVGEVRLTSTTPSMND
jgi:V-type H+-transporting ATPase subunit E